MITIVIRTLKKHKLVTVPNGFSFLIVNNRNRGLLMRVEETSFLHFDGALLTKKFAELEKIER